MSRLSNVLSLSWLNRTRQPSRTDRGSEPTETDQDLVGSATSVEEVISALAQRGCADLTPEIGLAACSDLPRDGRGFCDVYQGGLDCGTKIAIKSLKLYDKPGMDNEKGKILKVQLMREATVNPADDRWLRLACSKRAIPLVKAEAPQCNAADGACDVSCLNPDVDRVGLCIHVCVGLSYIHDNGMVHGDLKAANIMISHDGEPIIADFGSSQLRSLTLRFTNTANSGLSIRWAVQRQLSILNTTDNLLRHLNYFWTRAVTQASKKSDVYAYGMTVLETLTGKVRFEEFSEQKVLAMVALKHQIPARPANGVSGDIWKLLERCWRREQSARPDIRDIEKQLRDVYFRAWVISRSQDGWSTGNLEMNESAMPEVAVKRTSGSDHPFRAYRKGLRGLSELATEHRIRNRLGESKLLLAEVLAVQKRVLAVDHPDTLQSMHNLAVTYDKQGRQAEAESLEIETLAARKQVLGADHPDTLQTMHNLAATYYNQSQLAKAELLEVETLTVRKRVLGADHPATLLSMGNLAITYDQQGRLAEAESLKVEMLAAQKPVLGRDHPATQ